jgi:polyhydroxyalkanoate synthesis repressor PhaR
MPVIKRYPNRKLYDTERKQYVALDQIADLIRRGQEVQVIDNVTGEDLTAIILTQIILEQEKRQAGWVPSGILAGLVRARSQTLHALRQSLAGPPEWRQDADSEIEARIRALVERGELAEEEAMRWREKLLPGAQIDEDLLAQLLAERGVPTRKDLRRVSAQLEALVAALKDLAPGEDRGDAQPAAGEGNLSSRDASNE